MSGHKNFSMWLGFIAALALTLAGCNDGPRGCLGLGCSDGGTTQSDTNLTGTTEVSVTSSTAFTCALVSDYLTVRSGEEFGITVVAQGQFTPPVNITSGLQFPVEGFYSAIKIFGSIANTTAATVVRNGGVVMKDARGVSTSCSHQVSVLSSSSTSGSSGLACDIIPNNQSPSPGARVDFRLVGRGGSGVYTFKQFSPIAGQSVADTYISKVSDTESRVSYSYSNPVTRFASVVVTNGANSNICRVPIFVGGYYPSGYQAGWDWSSLPPWFYYNGFFPAPTPVTPPSQNTCDIQMTPSPGIAGVLSNLRVTVPAYVGAGPFQISTIVGYNNSKSQTSNIDDLPGIARPSLLERKIRIRDAGYHRLTVTYRNAAGTITGSCGANHQANPANQFAISPDQVSNLSVNTYSGGTPPVYGATTTVPDTNHRGARVAFGDVNGDGIPDLIIGSGKDLVNSNPVYRVVVRDGRNLATVLYDFNPLPSHPDGNGGVFVAGGDVNADGKAEVIVGQDGQFVSGRSGSWIKVYDFSTGAPVLKHAVQPFGSVGNYGVRVAAGDVNGDGFADILAIPGAEGGALVKVYNGQQLAVPATPVWSPLYSFTALTNSGDAPLRSGAFIAAGDLNADGKADILTSLDTKSAFDGANYKRAVYIYSGANGALQTYKPQVFGALYDGGLRIAAGDIDGDGRADILAVPGPGVPNDGYGSQFKALDFVNQILGTVFWPQNFSYASGFFVGGGAGGL